MLRFHEKLAILLIFMAAAFLIYSVFPAGKSYPQCPDSQSFCPASVLLYHSICKRGIRRKPVYGQHRKDLNQISYGSKILTLLPYLPASSSAMENASPLPSKPVLITFDDGS